MVKTTPSRYTWSMARQTPQASRVDKSENYPIEVEEDSSTKPPDSPPLASPQHHQTESGKAYFDTYLTQFDDHQQPTFFDENIYQKPCRNPIVILENPSVCYDKLKEETPEREDLFRKLKKKNKQLKKEIKEYEVLTQMVDLKHTV